MPTFGHNIGNKQKERPSGRERRRAQWYCIRRLQRHWRVVRPSIVASQRRQCRHSNPIRHGHRRQRQALTTPPGGPPWDNSLERYGAPQWPMAFQGPPSPTSPAPGTPSTTAVPTSALPESTTWAQYAQAPYAPAEGVWR